VRHVFLPSRYKLGTCDVCYLVILKGFT
jgi:hypothetical protein